MAESQELETGQDPSALYSQDKTGQENLVTGIYEDQTTNIANLKGNRQDPEHGSSSSPGLLQKSRVDDTMLDETPGAVVELAAVKTPEHTPVPSVADSNVPTPISVIPDYGDDWVSDSNTSDDPLSNDSNRSGSVAYPSGYLDWSVVDAKLEADSKFKNELRKLAKDSKSSWVMKHLLNKAYPETQKKSRSKAKVPESNKGIITLEDCIGRKFIFPFDRCKTWEGMRKLVSAAFRIDDPISRMVGLGCYYLLGPDKSIILPSTWEEVIKPGWSLTMELWPTRNDKVDEGGPNVKLIGSSDLEYTTSYKTQFKTAEPFNHHFNRGYPGFVESDEALQSVNVSEDFQSAALFSEGSRMERANTETTDLGAIHASEIEIVAVPKVDASSRESLSSTTFSKDNHINNQSAEAPLPNTVQSEGNTSKGKKPLRVKSKMKHASATQFKHGQSKNKVAQTDLLSEKTSQEPQPSQTPAKSGAPAKVENSIQPPPQQLPDSTSFSQPPPLPEQPISHPSTNQYWNAPFSTPYGYQPSVPAGVPSGYLPYNYNSYPLQPNIHPQVPSAPPFPLLTQPQPPPTEPPNVPHAQQWVKSSAVNPDIPTANRLPPIPRASRTTAHFKESSRNRPKRATNFAPTSTDAEVKKDRKPHVSHGQSSNQSRKPLSSTDAHQLQYPGDFYYYSSVSEEDSYPEQTFTWRKIEPMPRKERKAFYRQKAKDYKAKFHIPPHHASEMKHKELSGDFAEAFPTLFNGAAANSWDDIGLTDGVLQQLMIALFSPTPSRYWTSGLQSRQTDYERSQYLGLVQTLRRLENVNKEIGCIDEFFPTMVLLLIHLGFASWEMATWSHKQKSGSALDCPMWKLQNLCYRRKILTQPGPAGAEKHLGQLHRKYIYAVFCAMNYKASQIDLIKWSEIKWSAEEAELSVGDVMMKALDKQVASHRPLPQTQDALFEARHLSIKALLEIGKIDIKWTLSLNEHLRLTNAANGKRIVHIFWDPSLLWMIHGYFDDLYRWPELVELKRTYAILFSPSRTPASLLRNDASALPETDIEASDKSKSFSFGATHNEYDINESYRLLPTPPHYQVSKEKAPGGKNTMKKCPTYLQAVQMHHEAAMTTTLNEMETFETYVLFGDRLREIHFHMNKSRPRGIFGLWRDRRDSLAWYTLWAALAFGSVSLFLALSSVIISAVQTKAAFEALHQSSTNT